MIKVMNSVEIEKKIRELVGHYLIKDYHVTVKRGDVILWLPDICKDSPFNKLMDEVYEALDDSIRITVIYPNNGKKVSEFIKENMEEIKRLKLEYSYLLFQLVMESQLELMISCILQDLIKPIRDRIK